ncbi:MAG TPA: hypothetical protein VKV40_24100 [Ktedonobacteraceae bacterium]|nr:hypothetical protein [Ktedonobacteraceae bacterium]
MTVPIVLGAPQIILLIVGLIGLILLISSLTSLAHLFHRRQELEEGGEREEYRRKLERYRHRHRFKWGRGMLGLVLLVIAICLLWLATLTQTYLGLTGDIRVAQVRATPVANEQHEMFVELILYNKDGQQTSDNTYLVAGDEWMLQGDIIKFPSWLNILGLHSGYKLTRLEGRFDDPNLERHATHTVIVLNGGDDQFFKTVQEQAWSSPFIQAAYGNGVFLAPDGKTYNVYVSQTGLYAEPAK